jgi:hypothetical protein
MALAGAVTLSGLAIRCNPFGSSSTPAGGPDAATDAPAGDSATSCELPATSELMLWLRASDIDASPGAPVSTWPDRSGHGRDFTQTQAEQMPSYAPNGLNGAAVVGFKGASYLALDHDASAAFKFVPGADVSIAMVAFSTSNLSNSQILFGNISLSLNPRQGFAFGVDDDGGTAAFGFQSSCCPVALYANDVTGAWQQLLGVRRGSTVSLYVNGQRGVDQPSGGSDAIDNAGDLWLGMQAPGYFPFQGSIAEVRVWSHALSDAERACLVDTLRRDYALP